MAKPNVVIAVESKNSADLYKQERLGKLYGMKIRSLVDAGSEINVTLDGTSDGITNFVRDIKKNHIVYMCDNQVGKIIRIISYVV